MFGHYKQLLSSGFAGFAVPPGPPGRAALQTRRKNIMRAIVVAKHRSTGTGPVVAFTL
jgi:hypothetical protein